MRIRNLNYFSSIILSRAPYAKAELIGGPLAPNIKGMVYFYPVHQGTLVVAEVYHLPPMVPGTSTSPPIGPFGFHIHEGNTCDVGDPKEPFTSALGHFNPTGAPHPFHAGDMPVLFADKNGYAYLAFYTDRFTPQQVVNRAVIIHQNPDDYRSQPAGKAGLRLACGIIKAI